MPIPVPEHGPCLVCGSENPKGFGLRWWYEDGRIFAEHTFTLAQQGPPGYAHGGALAAVLDEAMGAAVWSAGHRVLAGELHIRYLKPVPLGAPVRVEAWVVGREGKKVFTEGRITLPDGEVATTARGVFVEAPHIFPEHLDWGWRPEIPEG